MRAQDILELNRGIIVSVNYWRNKICVFVDCGYLRTILVAEGSYLRRVKVGTSCQGTRERTVNQLQIDLKQIKRKELIG